MTETKTFHQEFYMIYKVKMRQPDSSSCFFEDFLQEKNKTTKMNSHNKKKTLLLKMEDQL